jgi:hypothetical protein
MNERIKELWTQAEDQHVDSEGKVWTNTIYKTRDKFAELIVRECAEVADKNSPLSYPDHGIKIKRHFGVD